MITLKCLEKNILFTYLFTYIMDMSVIYWQLFSVLTRFNCLPHSSHCMMQYISTY